MTSIRALVAATAAVAVVVVALAFWGAAWVFLMLFGAVLLGIGIRALADPLARRTRLGPGASVTVVVLSAVAVCSGAGALFAPTLSEQIGHIGEELPAQIDAVEQSVRSWPISERLGFGEEASEGEGSPSAPAASPASAASGPALKDVVGGLAGAVSTAVSVVGAVLLVLASGLYFAYEPQVYLDGVVNLVPRAHRPRAREVLEEIGGSLRWWLTGQLVSMAVVGTLMTLGLWVLGVPMALALGIIAGVLDFVPNFGPWFALVPAVLLSGKPLLVLGLWAVVQALEGYVVTPLVQREAVQMPPVLLIGAQVVMSVLLGPAGLLTAAPLVVVAMILVKRLYREDVLGDPVPPPSWAEGGASEG